MKLVCMTITAILLSLSAMAGLAQNSDQTQNAFHLAPLPLLRIPKEARVLKKWCAVWNEQNGNNVQDILDLMSDVGPIFYTDVLNTAGINSKSVLKTYLTNLYARFPRQSWGEDVRVYPSFSTPGEWTYYYHFHMYDINNKVALSGTGMERVTFDSQEKLVSDEIHLLFDQNLSEVSTLTAGLVESN